MFLFLQESLLIGSSVEWVTGMFLLRRPLLAAVSTATFSSLGGFYDRRHFNVYKPAAFCMEAPSPPRGDFAFAKMDALEAIAAVKSERKAAEGEDVQQSARRSLWYYCDC